MFSPYTVDNKLNCHLKYNDYKMIVNKEIGKIQDFQTLS